VEFLIFFLHKFCLRNFCFFFLRKFCPRNFCFFSEQITKPVLLTIGNSKNKMRQFVLPCSSEKSGRNFKWKIFLKKQDELKRKL
jgi:hypothetical protein